jgi:dihydropteroate synthase-like protein
MKVLLVTGQLAQETVSGYAKECPIETEVLALKTAVAAFLNPQIIATELKALNLSGVDVILVPGLIRGDTALITAATGIPAYKGSQYAADLPTVLDALDKIQLSTTIPACELMREQITQTALQEIAKTEANRAMLLKEPCTMLIGNVAIGKPFPMRVLAEIVDAALMDKETIQRTGKRFVAAGADIVDVGMVAGESKPEEARQIVKWVKEVVDVPVSIDTLDPAEIKAAVEAGAELILSGDAGNLDDIAPYVQAAALVLVPTNQRTGFFPKAAHERVTFLEEIFAKAKKLGLNRLIADLIVDPLDVLESFIAFKEFAAQNPEVPLFVGISNVTELMDADSIGLNALLAKFSSEVGGNILLATEKSQKAQGTVAEEAAATKMMFLSKKRRSVPKDLGIDLLVVKDKRRYEEPYKQQSAINVYFANEPSEPPTLDHQGMFKIAVNRQDDTIVATHYKSSDPTVPLHIVEGKTARAVYGKIVELGLVSEFDHAVYLGCELEKAEIALTTGKAYVQDIALFKKRE